MTKLIISATEGRQWQSEMPTQCEVCKSDLCDDGFIDGRMKISGQWSIMCKGCFMVYGVGLGVGRGQEYDGQGYKVDG